MNKTKQLTFIDYFTNSADKLAKHPDFSPHAMRVVKAISKLTTGQLENINVNNMKGK